MILVEPEEPGLPVVAQTEELNLGALPIPPQLALYLALAAGAFLLFKLWRSK